MKKRALTLFLALTLCLSLALPASAISSWSDPAEAAHALSYLGLFRGTGNGFELERLTTRQEMVVMVIRLLGMEDLAFAAYYSHPFTDVDSWASPYIAVAYEYGLINGVSDNQFGRDVQPTMAHFLTLVLRALWYNDSEGDFHWTEPWVLSDAIGLTDGYYNASTNLTRGNMVIIAYNALATYLKDDAWTLMKLLKYQLAIPFDAVYPALGFSYPIYVEEDAISLYVGETAVVYVYFDAPHNTEFYSWFDADMMGIEFSFGAPDTDGWIPVVITAYDPCYGNLIFEYWDDDVADPYALNWISIEVFD